MQQNVQRLTELIKRLPKERSETPVAQPVAAKRTATAMCTVHCGCGRKWEADGKHLMEAVVEGVRHAKNTGHSLNFDGQIKVVEVQR